MRKVSSSESFSFGLTVAICFFLEKTIYEPPIDHTYGSSSGHYLLFNLSKQSKNTFPIESTKKLLSEKYYCLRLWYYHDGERPVSFSISANYDQGANYFGDISSSLDTRVWQQVRSEYQILDPLLISNPLNN